MKNILVFISTVMLICAALISWRTDVIDPGIQWATYLMISANSLIALTFMNFLDDRRNK